MKTLFTVAALFVSASACAEDAQGYWTGKIANSLNVVVQFEKVDSRWDGSLSVPEQNLKAKVENLVVTPEQLSFSLAKFNATFAAKWSSQEKVWIGTWTQGQATPLILTRATAASLDALTPKRPQEAAIAARKATYRETEVSFTNDKAKITLAGTLTLPQGKGPFPAVVLVHGSGPVNRDEEVFKHRPFLIWADHLARHGIAVLRYDKRGVAKSTGTFRNASSYDFADDAAAALHFLRGMPEVDARRTGVIGHSEGGLIGPLLASRDPSLGFVVMLAGPGVRGEVLLTEQLARASAAQGAPAEFVAKERALNQALFAAMVSEASFDSASQKATVVLGDAESKGILPAGMSKILHKRFVNPWFHTFLAHDPAPALRTMRQPVLVLNGELDMQVPSAMDLEPIRLALKDNPRAIVKELPKLNHLFQTAKTGAGSEYGAIEETVAPLALEMVSEWIRATAK
ncbi:MAG: alpha/beta fold hydrolase [Pseudomonadota bacterium]